MDGRDDLFADLIHFNDRGAEIIAGLIADRITDPGMTARLRAEHAAKPD